MPNSALNDQVRKMSGLHADEAKAQAQLAKIETVLEKAGYRKLNDAGVFATADAEFARAYMVLRHVRKDGDDQKRGIYWSVEAWVTQSDNANADYAAGFMPDAKPAPAPKPARKRTTKA
jgi:hypothetical protein